jgi:hypothetical protein
LAGSPGEAAAEDAPHSQVLHGVKVYSQDPAYVIAVAGRYLVQIVRQHFSATGVSLLRRAMTDLTDQYPTFGYLGVVEAEANLMLPPDIREGVQANVKRFSQRMTGAAVVFEKAGFQATALRSVVTAIHFASRATHPNHIFAELRDGISWLTQLTGGEPTAARLLVIAKRLRSQDAANPGASTPP